MANGALDRFREKLLALLNRYIFESKKGKLPPILTENADEDITTDLTRDQQLVAEIFWNSVEIWESQDALRDITIYLSRTPFTRLGIPKSRYLLCQVANHLHDLYILKERVEAFVKALERKYKKDNPGELARLRVARDRVVAVLSDAVGVRGEHVHKRRFKDPELHRLAGFEIALGAIADERLRSYSKETADRLYREQRTKWKRIFEGNNVTIENALNEFFDAVQAFVFDETGDLRRPSHWLGANSTPAPKSARRPG